MIVTERFELPRIIKTSLRNQTPQFGFGTLGQIVYARTYSRQRANGQQEGWADTVLRVVEGWGSIYKWWCAQNRIPYDEAEVARTGMRMAKAIFDFKFLPPGRGLWIQGEEAVYERGSMALNNCAFVEVTHLSRDAAWAMDALMLGVGVGFGTREADLESFLPDAEHPETYVIPDSREGWVEATRRLIASYETGGPEVVLDYSLIRPYGEPIRGFGGTASGPDPLRQLHERLRGYLSAHARGEVSTTRLIADALNAVGACVVAGNVRRSAEIACGAATDAEFRNLKNYELYPEREDIGWMSNNSIVLADMEDFRHLPEIAEGIRLNGEPGVMNLLNVQKYGRYGDEMPDLATGCNPCVTGDTLVLTSLGYRRIDSVVDQMTDVWNGSQWSKVFPRVTGENQPIVRVNFDDGTSIDCTPYHGFHLSRSYRDEAPEIVEARDLRPGDKLWKYRMPQIEYEHPTPIDPTSAYTHGVFAGDGHLEGDRPCVWLYGDKQTAIFHALSIHSFYEDEDRNRTRVVLDIKKADKTFVPDRWSIDARLAWLAGLIDTDGTVTNDGSIQVTSTNVEFLRQVRLMLTTLAVQGKVTQNREAGYRSMPNGKGGSQSYWCNPTYRLQLCATDVETLGRCGLWKYLQRVSIDDVSPSRDARRFVKVVSVEQRGTAKKVYCFNEPKAHRGTFNGIVTGQCAEIPLESFELCNLVEVFPTRSATAEEFYEAVELATLYASTVSLLPTHNELTNAVIARNHRIGVSLSGVADWFDVVGGTEIITRMRQGYKIVRETNRRFARQMGVPESVRVTTVKPSGTISQLAGVSPGMHYPVYRRFIRRIRFGADTPLVPLLVSAGVPHEVDVNDKSGRTLVFEFPIETTARRAQRDLSMWQKGAMVVLLQRWWADNMVSNTITFDPKTEGHQIEDFLAFTVPFTKTISMLPDTDAGAFPQMPYESITVKEYEERSARISDIDWTKFSGSDGEDSRYCSNDLCLI